LLVHRVTEQFIKWDQCCNTGCFLLSKNIRSDCFEDQHLAWRTGFVSHETRAARNID
jgi:hypothetical protein